MQRLFFPPTGPKKALFPLGKGQTNKGQLGQAFCLSQGSINQLIQWLDLRMKIEMKNQGENSTKKSFIHSFIHSFHYSFISFIPYNK
jgi:hypothetical protein